MRGKSRTKETNTQPPGGGEKRDQEGYLRSSGGSGEGKKGEKKEFSFLSESENGTPFPVSDRLTGGGSGKKKKKVKKSPKAGKRGPSLLGSNLKKRVALK